MLKLLFRNSSVILSVCESSILDVDKKISALLEGETCSFEVSYHLKFFSPKIAEKSTLFFEVFDEGEGSADLFQRDGIAILGLERDSWDYIRTLLKRVDNRQLSAPEIGSISIEKLKFHPYLILEIHESRIVDS